MLLIMAHVFQFKKLPFHIACNCQEVLNFALFMQESLLFLQPFWVTDMLCYGVLAPQLFFNYSNLSILFCALIRRVSAKESTDGFIGISSSVIH